ncbi:hypothetical protein EVAR_96997_1 [Eumeta japonica]|uniref:Uncharacterized protein n=1 Tax=Eumeta variegata TaxID=151549 RepID=A0A4C1SQB6_EUMVA|nr:hypothetical protein EVAR_96997_1 [Eumeta japonica]
MSSSESEDDFLELAATAASCGPPRSSTYVSCQQGTSSEIADSHIHQGARSVKTTNTTSLDRLHHAMEEQVKYDLDERVTTELQTVRNKVKGKTGEWCRGLGERQMNACVNRGRKGKGE